jgi:hypothetical protein
MQDVACRRNVACRRGAVSVRGVACRRGAALVETQGVAPAEMEGVAPAEMEGVTQRRGAAGRRSGGLDVRSPVARRGADPGEAARSRADRPLPSLRGGRRHDPGRARRPAEVASREDRRRGGFRSRRALESLPEAGHLHAAQLHANPNRVAPPRIVVRTDLATAAQGRNGLRFATAWAARPARAWAPLPATGPGRGCGSVPIPRPGPIRSPAVSPTAWAPMVAPAARLRILGSVHRRSPSLARQFDPPVSEKARESVRVLARVRVHGGGRGPILDCAAARAAGRTRRPVCLVDGQSHSYPISLPDAIVGRHGCLPRGPLSLRAPLEDDPSQPNRAPFWRPLVGREAPEARH